MVLFVGMWVGSRAGLSTAHPLPGISPSSLSFMCLLSPIDPPPFSPPHPSPSPPPCAGLCHRAHRRRSPPTAGRIEPWAFRMRCGCDTTTPCVRSFIYMESPPVGLTRQIWFRNYPRDATITFNNVTQNMNSSNNRARAGVSRRAVNCVHA